MCTCVSRILLNRNVEIKKRVGKVAGIHARLGALIVDPSQYIFSDDEHGLMPHGYARAQGEVRRRNRPGLAKRISHSHYSNHRHRHLAAALDSQLVVVETWI